MLQSRSDALSCRAFISLLCLCAAGSGCYDPVEAVRDDPIIPSGGGTPPDLAPQGGPGDAMENNHHESHFIVEADEGIALKGTISCAEAVTGNIQLDFLRLDENGRRSLVHGMQVPQLGAWSEKVPEDFGEVYIMAFADNDRNGPSELDPRASVGPIQIGSSAIDGIDLVLVKNADMGRLALSSSGEPPSGSPPPGGSPDAAPRDAAGQPEEAGGPTEPPTEPGRPAAPPADEGGDGPTAE